MSVPNLVFARRVVDSTQAVFGDSPITHAVSEACAQYEVELQHIESSRGIDTLLLAIVGAKGQGKTWAARQFVKLDHVRNQLRSGDLIDDATTRLVWVGPVAPDGIDPTAEIYHPCQTNDMAHIGQPYVLLDTPGLTDANHHAANLAAESLALAPIKLLVVARDQIRAAANLTIAKQIDGSVCIPVISSVEPEEMPDGVFASGLADDVRSLRDQLQLIAPRVELAQEVLVPDFEITGDEAAAGEVFIGAVLDRFNDLGLTEMALNSAKDQRMLAASQRLQDKVATLIGDELPQLGDAVAQLNRETELVPERVLNSLLGSESVLETGVRMRLRARLVGDTSLLWFPYRTVMSTLNLTQGAWDRVMLAMAGSVPSLFGALASFAKNVRDNQDFESHVSDGIRKRTQEQVEERLRPLCDQFHRTVLKLKPRSERLQANDGSSGMRLSGIEELQTQSQRIFDSAIDRHAMNGWMIQLYALIGVALFWVFMSGPIVLIYREYFSASVQVITGQETKLENFPHPTSGLILTSVFLSTLPLAIYCMVVLTFALSGRKIRRVAEQIIAEHDSCIESLQESNVIRLDFEDQMLSQAEFLLNLRQRSS